ncbi:YhdT family protein [Aminithiophilus ramosus]|uniref:YhdT family protein n=2 Tax=Synergistales TaxID=649776 RepID=A0A9Q7A9K4_9BACT|nr:YhdT family protein [Aminithiophilus ramosus]QTX33030.1 YhdT family protein [Aminithiophilus ramosus]QVL37209.1 YhdT family protein [Synergistota bacterium]
MAAPLKGRGRFRQADREALYALALALLNFLWWYATAYGLGSGPVETYRYIAGFPAWFFLSAIVGFLLFSFLAAAMVKLLFRDMPLDDEARR